MKNIKEQIEVMTHYMNGGEVEFINNSDIKKGNWITKTNNSLPFDWEHKDYRIKKEKKTMIIEKWLIFTGVAHGQECYRIEEGNQEYFKYFFKENQKSKLLETYEVEI